MASRLLQLVLELLALCLALGTGCARARILPPDWPIPQLSLPDQSRLLEVSSKPPASGATVRVATFTATFASPLAPEDVIADLQGKLKPLRYLRAAPRLEPLPNMRTYLSPDGKVQVLFDFGMAGPSGGEYWLNIIAGSRAMPELTRDGKAL